MGPQQQAGPWAEELTGHCTYKSQERSRAGGHRPALDLRKVS